MNRKAISLVLALNLLVATALAGPGFCQGAGKQQYCPPKTSEAPMINLKGKVIYNQRNYNYMFHQQDPPYADMFILNSNVDELKTLAAKDQIVTVEGYLPQGADHLLIEKIDGKKFGACK
jgi:hypothetical protein